MAIIRGELCILDNKTCTFKVVRCVSTLVAYNISLMVLKQVTTVSATGFSTWTGKMAPSCLSSWAAKCLWLALRDRLCRC